MPIRVNGIDTPELKNRITELKALAVKAKELTGKKLKNTEVIEQRNVKRGKYFRLLTDVYCDGVNLADELRKAGLVKEYEGGTRERFKTRDEKDAEKSVSKDKDVLEIME